MRIRRVGIQNFRGLEDVSIAFDEVTTFLGPNGAGKSSILRALDWFFNGTAPLAVEDVYRQDAGRVVVVEVEFGDLTDADRETLEKYSSPGAESVRLWKTWRDGEEKLFGRGQTFPPFDVVRHGVTAADRKTAWQELRVGSPELDLPAWSNNAAVMDFMATWEASHQDALVAADVESASHFFGFAGRGLMSGMFDYIFVSADLRAAEEASGSRSAIVGRILERAIDTSAADAEIVELVSAFEKLQAEVHERHFSDQLKTVSQTLTMAVSQFAAGREVSVRSRLDALKAQRAQFDVSILDAALETQIDRQGHGFQRALLIAALRMLAEHGREDESSAVICLAIEEPELYQHPLQARTFAAVLRNLAEDRARGVQVTYATHSPYFIEARSFHQIRRVSRREAGDAAPRAIVVHSSVERVLARLQGFVDPDAVARQLEGVCLGTLSEGFFAEVVLLVEGSTDRAVLTGAAVRESIPLLLDGIFIAEAGSKQSLLLPYVILDELGIPAYVVADNDSHLRDELDKARVAGKQIRVKQLESTVKDCVRWNRVLMNFFNLDEVDWPTGRVAENFTFVDGGLEQALERDWPGWVEAKQSLVQEGAGFSGKDQATYQEATRLAEGAVPELLTAVIAGARSLRRAA